MEAALLSKHVKGLLSAEEPLPCVIICYVCQFGELAASGMGRRCLYELLPQV
jgi:hypothetical protein